MISSLQTSIEILVREAFLPLYVEVQDDSAQHAGHAGARPEGGSHFSVFIVSASFLGKSLMERHRMVYRILRPLMEAEGIHALAIKTLTEEEWKLK